MNALCGCGWLPHQSALEHSFVGRDTRESYPVEIHFQNSVHDAPVESARSSLEFLPWNDILFGQQWYLRNTGQAVARLEPGTPAADIRLPADLWGSQTTPSPVILALIDTGIERSHPDFDSRKILENEGELGVDEQGRDKANNQIDDDRNGYTDDTWGWNFADDSPTLSDTLGHGTHLAGLLISKPDNQLGLASPWTQFKLLPIQIFSGARPSVPAVKIASAIRYAVDRGAKVINASFGTPSWSVEILSALEYARRNDVLVVSAVGNFRRNLDDEPSYPASFQLENQIAVAASDNHDLVTSFSNFGAAVDVFAPGIEIVSTGLNGTFVARSGTSQAAPLVAGVAAELRARFPNKTAAQIKQLIIDAADEKPGLFGFSPSGRRLNFENAIRALQGERIPPFEPSHTRRITYRLESEHPYRGSVRTSYRLEWEAHVRAFRIHFERFSTQSSDTLLIRDASGKLVQRLSGTLGAFWTAPIEGSAAVLEFQTDVFVSDWGWKIDTIETVAR